jgi:hypothetical protein
VLPGHEWWNQEAMNEAVSYNYQLCSRLEPHYCLQIDKNELNKHTVEEAEK